jgi:hypothetical protein
MSGNGDDECPRCPRVRAYSYDVIRTAATIHEETSSTDACSGMTTNIFRSGSGNQDSVSRNRRPVRRANTWGQ